MSTSVVAPPAPSGADPSPPPGRPTRWWPPVLALAVAGLLVYVSVRWGEALIADGLRMKVHSPPFRGPTDWRPGWPAAWPLATGGVLAVLLPVATRRLRWGAVLVVGALAGIAWAVSLALVDGVDALTLPFTSEGQYLNTVKWINDLPQFWSTFSDRIATYNIHTQGHPPGMVTVLWWMDRIGLGGRPPAAVLAFAGGGVTIAAAAAVVRDVAGEPAARRAVPLLALAPAALWWSSADPFFAAVAALGVLGVVRATARPRADGAAALGGLAFGVTAYLSYGLVLLALVPAAVAVQRRRLRPLVVAGAAALGFGLAVTALTGFVWWDGLLATRERYFAGVASIRPYDYFLVANLAVFAVMVGPAAVAGLARRATPPALHAVIVGGIVAVAVGDLSGMSKAEVERIWIPFVPWVAVAGLSVLGERWATRAWLVAQVLVAVLVAVTVRSPW